MVKEGIVKEVGQFEEEDTRSGRKKVLNDIDYNYKYVIGINIEAFSINIGVSNIDREIVSFSNMETDKGVQPKELLMKIANECMSILWKANIFKQDIIGVGIIGTVDASAGISKHAYGLGQEKVNVKKILEDALDLEVIVDNNVRTMALREIDYNTQEDMSNVIYIKYGPEIGSSVIINNDIYYGSKT
ncbi:hypothetical protein SH2C18_14410 [Clostridium sediminicola]|uniref:ROK family protein n=1 Tax=Clostridium sediminicola TaxID=3114879 RepID=UPI0031F26C0E